MELPTGFKPYRKIVFPILLLFSSLQVLSQTSADSVTISVRRYAASFPTVHWTGQFNGWNPTAWPMSFQGDYWLITKTFPLHSTNSQYPQYPLVLGDSAWQYKFTTGSGSNVTWTVDPLNPETNPADNNNSVLRLSKLFWFQYHQTESGDQITKITVGLVHANSDSITSIKLSTGATGAGELTISEIVSSYDRTTRILTYALPSSISKSSYIRLVGYNNRGDSVIYQKGGYVVPVMQMPSYARHGVTLPSAASNDSTTFRIRVAGKDVVLLRIAPAGQSPSTATPMVMRKNISSAGDWWINVKLQPGTYEYLYEIENGKLIHDPWGRDVGRYGTTFTVGPAGLTADDYVWKSTSYQRPPLEKLVIYELNVGEFAGGYYNKSSANQGTFLELATLMGHFDSLGVNAIELMPINDYGSIGRSGHSWGYDINSHFVLEPGYGTPRDFKALVDSAHAHGIAVIVDVVFNHLNETSALWQMQPDENANPYFKHPSDRRPNEDGLVFFKDLDHWTPETQELVYESLKMWLDVYRVDGFRYDYTQGIGWTVSDTTVGILGWANKIAREYGNTVYQIAEHLPESPALIFYSGLTSGWHDSFHDEVFKDLIPSQKPSLFNVQELVLDLGAYAGNDAPTLPNRYANRREPVNATVNHDEQSLIYEMSTFQNVSLEEAIRRDKLYATFMFTSLGVPMLWQGMEFSAPRGWRNDDEKLRYRPLEWSLRSTARGQAHFKHYRALILQRKSNPALFNGELKKLARYDNDRVLVWGFEDTVSSAKVMVVANLSPTDRTITNVPWLATGNWYDIFDESTYTVNTTPVAAYSIRAYTANVYSNKRNRELGIPPSIGLSSTVPTEFRLHQNFPNPFNPTTMIRYEVPFRSRIQLKVYSVLGEELTTVVDNLHEAGTYSASWNGRRGDGIPVASGLYFVRLIADDYSATKKMVLLR